MAEKAAADLGAAERAHSELTAEKAAVAGALVEATAGKESSEKLGAELSARIADLEAASAAQAEERDGLMGACSTLQDSAILVAMGSNHSRSYGQ